jgi:hypothetical protein
MTMGEQAIITSLPLLLPSLSHSFRPIERFVYKQVPHSPHGAQWRTLQFTAGLRQKESQWPHRRLVFDSPLEIVCSQVNNTFLWKCHVWVFQHLEERGWIHSCHTVFISSLTLDAAEHSSSERCFPLGYILSLCAFTSAVPGAYLHSICVSSFSSPCHCVSYLARTSLTLPALPGQHHAFPGFH